MSIGLTASAASPENKLTASLYRLSVDQYQRMKKTGILTHEDRVELLEGLIYFRIPPSTGPLDEVYSLSVEQYHEMERIGIINELDRVELLEGRLVRRAPINPRHRRATEKAFSRRIRLLPEGWYATMQMPITTATSEPQPDISVIRGSTDDYPDRHPGPAEVALVVEVSDSSLDDDRTRKRRMYARAGITQYWIVNVVDGWVEVYSHPIGDDFTRRRDCAPLDELSLTIEGKEIGTLAVSEILD